MRGFQAAAMGRTATTGRVSVDHVVNASQLARIVEEFRTRYNAPTAQMFYGPAPSFNTYTTAFSNASSSHPTKSFTKEKTMPFMTDEHAALRKEAVAQYVAVMPNLKEFCENPATPAIGMLEFSTNYHNYVVVYRKRDGLFVGCYSDGYSNFTVRLADCLPESGRQGTKRNYETLAETVADRFYHLTGGDKLFSVKRVRPRMSSSLHIRAMDYVMPGQSGRVNPRRRRMIEALSSAYTMRTADRNIVGLPDFGCTPTARYKGRTLDETSFDQLRSYRKALNQAVAKAARANKHELDDDYDGPTVDEAAELLFDLMVTAERGLYSPTEDHYRRMPQFVADSFSSTHNNLLEKVNEWLGYDEYKRFDCGHLGRDGEETVDVHDSSHCEDCADTHLVEIEGDFHHRDSLYYWESDGEYHLDPEPDRRNANDSTQLVSWGNDVGHYVQHDKTLVSSAYGDFTMGVELEVEDSTGDDGTFDETIVATRTTFNERDTKGGYVVLKRDGSLGEYGFEIVTAARRMEEHLEHFGHWKPSRNLESWNAEHCGMHVHVDSRAFTALTLGKFMMFINSRSNMDFIREIAGRHPYKDGSASDYCRALDQSYLTTPSTAIKTSENDSRYRMVNLCNLQGKEMERLQVEGVDRESKGSYSTVELRIFRGTLRKARLLAQIEFTHAAVNFCRVASWNKLDGTAFKSWLATCAGRYKNLAKWYGITVVKEDNRPNATRRLPSKAEV